VPDREPDWGGGLSPELQKMEVVGETRPHESGEGALACI
jgi:hypothetical protein